MRKALLPMIASLALCGAATVALIATNASAAQAVRKPLMVAFAADGETAAPKSEGGAPPRDGMMRRGMMSERREQFCKDMYARRVGEMAYFEAKLSLTAAQAPLFDGWKQASLAIAKRRSDTCGAHERPRNAHMPTLIEGMNRQEERLKQRLADLESERPALEALYTALNPTQKMELSRGIGRLLVMRGMMEHHMGGHGMMGGRMMMGMMGRPRPPEIGPGMAPPPPAQ
ncbi:MAG TPA: Spy/CpxP family protein refolding chaperone [Rhizomicrobium sp.]